MTFYFPLPLPRNLTLSAGGGDEALEILYFLPLSSRARRIINQHSRHGEEDAHSLSVHFE